MDTTKFLSAQSECYSTVKKELLDGKKQTHWIWFIFPQLDSLGKSEMSKFYGLSGVEEAREYYQNAQLRSNMNELLNVMLNYSNSTEIEDVFGDIDAKKLRSSMTLFYLATKDPIFKKIIDRFYGSLDNKTVLLLNMR